MTPSTRALQTCSEHMVRHAALDVSILFLYLFIIHERDLKARQMIAVSPIRCSIMGISTGIATVIEQSSLYVSDIPQKKL